ncbi:translation initiation factor IF-3 [Candidatus Parcubacteria bacterium]|nr:translation initiation factor IF-3 [Candidatus Parcubacteria bacterium]
MSSTRINNQIKSKELRVVTDTGENLGVMLTNDAMAKAKEMGLDLIEISPNAKPPVAKIMDYGKFQYDTKKKAKEAKAKAHNTETKSIQIKVTTGEHDLALKARRASEWLKEGHRIKVELYLRGREKGTTKEFQQERLERVLNLVAENYKIADAFKKGPKGLMVTIERDTGKKTDEKEDVKPKKVISKETPIEGK